MNLTIPKLVLSLLLIVGIFDMPYGYYTFLRITITLSSIFLAYLNYKDNSFYWFWFFCLVAILFNPVFPIYLDKYHWLILDIVISFMFLVSIKRSINIILKNT